MHAKAPRDELIGRDDELQQLRAALDEAFAGRGSLYVLEGEAGIGKTRLAAALERIAAGRGARTAWGTCQEEAAPAYWPWRPIIARLGVDAGLSDRFALADAICASIRTASGDASAPATVLFLDDVQWADQASLRLLRLVAGQLAELPCLVTITRRISGAEDPAAGPLHDVERERVVQRLELQGLSAADIGRLMTSVTGRSTGAELTRAVEERTFGNPFFVIEIARLMRRDHASDQDAAGLPDSIRDVMGRRAAGLSRDGRQIIGAASVLGLKVDVPMLVEVTGRSHRDVIGGLDEGSRAGLLRADGDAGTGADRVAFAHGLVREALEQAMPLEERLDLHRRAGNYLEASAAHRLNELSYHFDAAAPLGETARAHRYTVAAAGVAARERAYEQEALLLRRVLRLLDLDPSLDDRGSVLLRIAQALQRGGMVEEAWEASMRVAAHARATADAKLLARAALVVRGVEGHDVEIARLCEEALAAFAPASDTPETLAFRASLIGQLVIAAGHLRRPPPDGISAAVAIELAETAGDPDALLVALHARQMELSGPRHPEARMELAARTAAVARGVGDLSMLTWARAWEMDAWFELGRRPQIDMAIAALDEIARETREPLAAWRVGMARATLAQIEGRFAASERLADEAAAIGERGGLPAASFLRSVLLLQGQLLRGDMDPLIELFEPAWAYAPPSARVYQAAVFAVAGRLDEARAAYGASIRSASDLPEDDLFVIALAALAETAWALKTTEGVHAIRHRLEPFAAQMTVSGSGQAGCGAPVAHYLGTLALLMGDHTAAEAQFRAALEHELHLGALPYAAMTRVTWARQLMARGTARDLRSAEGLLDLAADAAARYGLRRVADEVKALAPALDGRRLLSPREREVATLVGEGLSNRAIAERLVLSQRTAENHVKSILDKLGFDSRAQVAAWVASREQRELWVPD